MSGGNKNIPKSYTPTGQPQADQTYQGLSNNMASAATALPSQVVPQYQNLTQGFMASPYADQAQAGANAAGAAGTAFGNTEVSGANKLFDLGFDPQQSLYNTQYRTAMDNANAVNSSYGLGTSPYGAGLADQASQRFNADWFNQQLQRAIYGAAAGSQLGQSGLTAMTTGATLPYQTASNIYGMQTGALNTQTQGTTGAYGLAGQSLGALSDYLKLGQSATSINQNAEQIRHQENQDMWSNIMGGLGTAFGAAANPLSLLGTPIWG